MLQGLENSGLIKQTGAGQYEGVDSYAEHQQLAAQKHTESQLDSRKVSQIRSSKEM